ncbi:hypothetical protein K470DRAFT_210662 [Piedraia hortae CBS 480.64]|uniref:WD40 repeat-like protein n=1 Tax=Piedraia hortae CBS 480.64 TaxID=1314780 RepID=A0A6A7C8Z3_9PEZI|nr:hypothetical protein K470DRAFT_210662 [Piedraia hortae CBS 480.64]
MKEEKVSAAAGQGEQPAKATKTGPFKPASPSLSPYAVIDQSPPKEVKSNGVSQRPRKRSVIDPPPPHLPQQHFYQVPDFGLNIAAEDHSGSTSCWRLDSFADAGDVASSKRSRDALLVGFSDALEVYRVLPDRMEVIGRLEGLRGRVVGAKIVPCTQKQDWKRNLRPLVALIIHGPSDDYGKDFDTKGDDIHQTTVDIFSLKTQQHVSTIFKSACVRKQSSGSTSTPVGGLSVDAAGKFITVASGNSGEVYIFSDTSPAESPEPRYECVGKVWTALQHGTRNAGDADATAIPVENRPRKPLMSLRGRWLAIVPPYTAAGTAIHCTPSLPQSKGHVVGMGTVTAPPQPLVTCEVAGIDDEGTLRWLSRKAAQGLVKASQKGVEMGLQGWKELTSPAPSITARVAAPATRTAFPPTNAPAEGSDRLDKEPALVSIIDLEQLLDTELLKPRQAPLPMATFALVEGCNYISLSADGLRLLTSNRHGDMSFIWDLTHMAHGSSSVLADDRPEQGPHVKQVDKVERSSPSVIVDTVWPGPDNWLAILTSHGTIHLHEFQTKPSKKKKRRGTISVPSNKAEATVEVSPGRSPPSSGGLLGGWRSWSQSVSSQAMALKSQYALPTTFAGFKETAAAAGAVSRRAVARGIGQGYMAARSGASDMWHAEDNKVRIKESVEVGSIMWMQWHNDRVLTVATRRQLSLYSVEHVSRQRGEVMVPGLKRHKQPRIFTLPGEAKNNCIGQGPHGFWSLRTADNNGSLKPSNGNTLTAAANDVETNPPYCPFHIDYRLSIYVFRDTYDPYNGQPWTFCAPLPAAVKVNDQQQQQLSRASSVKEFHDVADWEQDDTAMVESHLRIDGGEIFLNSRIKS